MAFQIWKKKWDNISDKIKSNGKFLNLYIATKHMHKYGFRKAYANVF